jgi:hypothetical protein
MIIHYDVFDSSGIAETFVIKALTLTNDDKDHVGDLDYEILKGDLSLLNQEQIESLEISCTFEYIRRWNDYHE